MSKPSFGETVDTKSVELVSFENQGGLNLKKKILTQKIWLAVKYLFFTFHCEFLEYWNTKKMFEGFDNIFHVYLLDVGIPKLWKKLNSHGGFLRAD